MQCNKTGASSSIALASMSRSVRSSFFTLFKSTPIEPQVPRLLRIWIGAHDQDCGHHIPRIHSEQPPVQDRAVFCPFWYRLRMKCRASLPTFASYRLVWRPFWAFWLPACGWTWPHGFSWLRRGRRRLLQAAFASDLREPVRRGPADSEHAANLCHAVPVVGQQSGGHLRPLYVMRSLRSAAKPTSRPGCGKPGMCTFDDDTSLKFRECSEQVKNQLSARRRRVDFLGETDELSPTFL